jgi:hypothetical protein
MKRLISALLCALFVLFNVLSANATSITWSGQTWDIRNDSGGPFGPGSNYFNGQGVTVDSSGNLHLKIAKDANNHWQCPEIVSQSKFGFGEYKWDIVGVVSGSSTIGIQNLDQNAVLGLFQYPTSDLGPDGTHEIDIELSYWGYSPSSHPYFMNWSTYLTYLVHTPYVLSEQQTWRGATYPTGYASNAPQTHSYYRTTSGITYKGVNDWSGTQFAYNNSTGLTSTQISQSTMPVHMNLWLQAGSAPQSGQAVEVIIHSFTFNPQQ